MMKRVKRLSLSLLFALLPAMCLVACQFGGIHYPEPSENPVKFTSEAQTKEIHVGNLIGIKEEKPETDKVERNNTQTATSNTWTKIENDWVIFKHGGSRPFDFLTIEVKENTTNMPRTYLLTLRSPLNDIKLEVTQSGK